MDATTVDCEEYASHIQPVSALWVWDCQSVTQACAEMQRTHPTVAIVHSKRSIVPVLNVRNNTCPYCRDFSSHVLNFFSGIPRSSTALNGTAMASAGPVRV